MPASNQPSTRKEEHVRLCTEEDVRYRTKTTGLERYDFDYVALPELDFEEVTPQTTFLGHTLRLPLIVSCMTGGYHGATAINAALARLCQRWQLAMGLGSMRSLLESHQQLESFRIARDQAPTIPIIANIGASQLTRDVQAGDLESLIDLVGADALTIHLNPLQELLQPEGTPHFRGVLAAIEQLVSVLPVPIIVKEVGAGISGRVAELLLGAGVRYVDVAGAGGTSWAGVELKRATPDVDSNPLAELWDCGIPTADCIVEVAALRSSYDFTLIASGGIASGFDAAKAIALGADLVGVARPLLQVYQDGGEEALERYIANWELQLRAALFVNGARTVSDLRRVRLRPRSPNHNR
ncbi:MAG: isopentenyl-diphosphate delta-isomerase [Candidatus Kapaibacterium sp.]|nr:MAG: isopentenyl-diphosphate delta-isomerase [Candidatus Kapabacteria bacterium]